MSGMKCANCGKGIMVGHNVSHAKNRTRKIFKPNLHSARILVGNTYKRMRLCTKCLRIARESGATPRKIEVKQEIASPAVQASA